MRDYRAQGHDGVWGLGEKPSCASLETIESCCGGSGKSTGSRTTADTYIINAMINQSPSNSVTWKQAINANPPLERKSILQNSETWISSP